MQLFTDKVYRFVFVSEAPSGDPSVPTDGCYKLLQILTYNELVSAGITTYSKTTYGELTFYKIENVTTKVVVYVPSSYIDVHPIIEVAEYPKIMLTLDLGVINNDTVLTNLESDIAGLINTYEYAAFKIGWEFGAEPAEYTVNGEVAAESDVITVTDATGITEGMAVDNNITGIPLGTVVESIDGNDVTISNSTTAIIADTTTIIIDTPTNEQPVFTADDCRLIAYDYEWLSEDEVIAGSTTVEQVLPGPYETRIALKAENASLRARVRNLEQALLQPTS
jgi:hypothetical protein